MELESIQWMRNQPLYEDYLHHYTSVQDLFEYDPWDVTSLEHRAQWLDQNNYISVDREALVQVLRAYNIEVGNKPEALKAIEELYNDKTLVIVGGQQAGLFTGPLYVIHKAITIIQSAKQASEKLGRKVIPVFWIAGEDHDFDEVNHLHYLSQENEISKIAIEHAMEARSSISRLQIDPQQWEQIIKHLEQALIDTEFKSSLMQKLREISLQSSTMIQSFAQLLSWIFGSHGLVLLDSDDPKLRQLESPMFLQLVEQHEKINSAFMQGKSAVENLGYVPQVEIQSDNVNLFIFDRDDRLLLKKNENGTFSDKKGERQYSIDALKEIAVTSPQQLSNNVVTRPLMQEFLFPVLGMVLGPGETAYMGLTKEAFHVLDMKMPIIIPRLEFSIVEETVQKHMQKFNISLDDVFNRFDDKKQQWLSDQTNINTEEQFSSVKKQVEALYQPLLQNIVEQHPGLKNVANTNLRKITEQIEFMQSRTKNEVESQYATALRQMNKIKFSLLPLDKPQERVYNVIPYMNKYGFDWIEELINTPIEMTGNHNIVYM